MTYLQLESARQNEYAMGLLRGQVGKCLLKIAESLVERNAMDTLGDKTFKEASEPMEEAASDELKGSVCIELSVLALKNTRNMQSSPENIYAMEQSPT